ncbi:hypothetical protein, partial [Pseudomonas sp. EA_15y_Pfl1_P102]|uniref:hypothetical protein n=1 Tax=Pseudomonas sp. EA_15y_Pfl1_P102 TaxID=3088685 RepID=UPI0030D7C3C8
GLVFARQDLHSALDPPAGRFSSGYVGSVFGFIDLKAQVKVRGAVEFKLEPAAHEHMARVDPQPLPIFMGAEEFWAMLCLQGNEARMLRPDCCAIFLGRTFGKLGGAAQ